MKKIIFMTLFLLVAMTGQSKGKGEFTVLQWNVPSSFAVTCSEMMPLVLRAM